MGHMAQAWQITVWNEEEFLAFVRHADAIRRPFGMRQHLVCKTGTSPREYTSVLVWEDEASYNRWRTSPKRQQLLHDASRIRLGEPRRLYRIVWESE